MGTPRVDPTEGLQESSYKSDSKQEHKQGGRLQAASKLP